MNQRLAMLSKKLRDERSRRVVFVSHCILNENTRFLGGAYRKGCVDEVVDSLRAMKVGIVQMPCPERECWGGVLKKDIMRAYGSRGTLLYRFYTALLGLWIWNTRRRYRRLANKVVEEMGDYRRYGFKVTGIVGIDGSPSCGVNKTLDMRVLLARAALLNISRLTRERNNQLVRESLADGRGYFIQELQTSLKKTKLNVKFYAHSLIREMNGEKLELGITSRRC